MATKKSQSEAVRGPSAASFGVPEALLGTLWGALGGFWAASGVPLRSPGHLPDVAGMLQDAPGPPKKHFGRLWGPPKNVPSASDPVLSLVLTGTCPRVCKTSAHAFAQAGQHTDLRDKEKQSNCKCTISPLQQNERCSKAGRAPCKFSKTTWAAKPICQYIYIDGSPLVYMYIYIYIYLFIYVYMYIHM